MGRLRIVVRINPDGGRIEVPAAGVLRDLETCWAIGSGTETMPLGTPVVFDVPATWLSRTGGVIVED